MIVLDYEDRKIKGRSWLEVMISLLDITDRKEVKAIYHQALCGAFKQGISAKVLTVTGTNGKGSTCALIESCLLQKGANVCAWFEGKVRINGDSRSGLISRAEHLLQKRGIHPHMQQGWAVAAEASKDLSDPVVLLEMPVAFSPLPFKVDVGVITNIYEDHLEEFGPELTDLARRKTRLVTSKGSVLLVGEDVEGEVFSAVEAVAKERDVKVVRVCGAYKQKLKLRGQHQRRNAQVAKETAELLGCSPEQVKTGLAEAVLPGRVQYVKRGEVTYLVDLCKNRQGAKVFAEYIKKEHKSLPVCMTLRRGHHLQAMAKELAEVAEEVILVNNPPENIWDKEDRRVIRKATENKTKVSSSKSLPRDKELIAVCGKLPEEAK